MSRILVAEDDEIIRDFLAMGLTRAGHDVTEAKDGGEVLSRLASPAPDLLLLDLQMPVLDGLSTLKRLRAAGAWGDVPILFLTASGAVSDMVEARRLGARGYLVKPIKLPVLIERVSTVLKDERLMWIDDVTLARRDA